MLYFYYYYDCNGIVERAVSVFVLNGGLHTFRIEWKWTMMVGIKTLAISTVDIRICSSTQLLTSVLSHFLLSIIENGRKEFQKDVVVQGEKNILRIVLWIIL